MVVITEMIMHVLPQASASLLISLLLVVSCWHIPVPVYADTKVLTAESTYTMGDGETPLLAELRALEQAKRLAVEQAGTYVRSYTKTKNYELTSDEAEALSAGLIEAEILEKKRIVVNQGFQFYVKIRARVKMDKLDEFVARLRQKDDRQSDEMLRTFKNLRHDLDRLTGEIDNLKQQMLMASGVQSRQDIATQILEHQRKLEAREWLEKAMKLRWQFQNYSQVVEYLSEAVVLDPSYAEAWFTRGEEHYFHKDYAQAAADFSQARRLGQDVSYLRGMSYLRLRRYQEAVTDFSECEQLCRITTAAGAINLHEKMGEAYIGLGKPELAVQHYTKILDDLWPKHCPEKDENCKFTVGECKRHQFSSRTEKAN